MGRIAATIAISVCTKATASRGVTLMFRNSLHQLAKERKADCSASQLMREKRRIAMKKVVLRAKFGLTERNVEGAIVVWFMVLK